jgi:DNA processing protein
MNIRGLLDLMISRIPGLKPVEQRYLSGKFDKEGDLAAISKDDLEAILGCRFKPGSWTIDKIRIQAQKDEAAARARGIKMVSLTESAYPPLVKEIYDPPLVLFYRGVLPNPEQPLLGIVGTRRPSLAAAKLAYELGRDLGRSGIPVVSGLALGIDAMAHRGNVDAGAPAIAVLGSGLDQVYPASNRPLARRIVESGGVLLSEYPPGVGPRKWNFPARNRIISALARGTVVVEAPERSGALITANFVLDHGRDLWVTTVGIRSLQGKGTAKFASEGAKVIDSAQDILAEWGLRGSDSVGLEPEENGIQETRGDLLSPGDLLASSLAKSLKMEI